jgi:hypothetical protein
MISFLELTAGAIVGGWIGNRIFKKKDLVIIKPQKLEVSVNLQQDGDWEIFKRIKDVLAKNPKVLELELCGLGHVSQDCCLAIYELLKNRPSSVRLEVKVLSSLYDGCLLFLLPANKVTVRKHCWVQIDDCQRLQEHDWSDMEERFGRSNNSPIKKPTFVSDYQNVWNILSESLDCRSIADKRVPLADLLRDFGLLDSDQSNRELEKLLAA